MLREKMPHIFYKGNLSKKISPTQTVKVHVSEDTLQQNITTACINDHYYPVIKKSILLCLIFMGLFIITNGQKNKIEYGFQSGLNLNSAYGAGVSKEYNSVLTGVSMGGHFKLNMRKRFGLKVILSYDQNGWAYRSLTVEDNTNTTGLSKADILIKLNYLNLPVLAEYSFGNKIKYNIDGGVFFGVLLSNQLETRLKPAPPNQGRVTVTRTKSGYRKSANFGISLDFGIQIPIASRIKLDFDLRNSTGLTNIYKSQSTNTSIIKTNTFSVLGGLTFEM